jgi:iron(III) transport system substrate-binding protein
MALPKGSKHPEAAKLMLNWAVTPEASQTFNKYYGIVGIPGLNNGPPNSIPDGDAYAADYSVEWSIDNRDRLIAEWFRRYNAKSEPKGN